VLISPLALEQLADRLAGDTRQYRSASVAVDVDPLDLVRAGATLFSTAGYFGRPGEPEIGGLGVAWRTVAPYGHDRFGALAASLEWMEGVNPQLRALIGFSFDPSGPHRPEWDGFTSTAAVVPMAAVVSEAGSRHLVVTLPPGRAAGEVMATLADLREQQPRSGMQAADHAIESRPAPAEWVEAVRESVETIKQGTMDKVVLARSVIVRADVAPAPFDLVGRLRSAYPGCFAFGWQEADRTFVGATPELLIERQGGRVRSQPLAGSAPRGEGEEEDRALGEVLMASEKNRREHAVVVDDIVARLRPMTGQLTAPSTPALLKMANVQHLASEVIGILESPRSVIEVAGELHPTPAVAGLPLAEALAFIGKVESIDRGWYSGGIGWTDGSGNGQIAVALRCALVRGDTAHLFAGAGIVAGSRPERELEETRLKFRPLLNLLTEA
jgi:salicylate biosynthesis isochorismate synthase